VEVFSNQAEQADEPDPEILDEGTHFHKLLEFLVPDSGSQIKPPMPSEAEVMNWLGVDQTHAQQVIERARTVLDASVLKPYLASDQWIAAWNELDIASKEGKSYRIDRLVEFADHLAILDYKLTIPDVGSERYAKYREQLKNYQAELSRIRQDRPNKAYLVSAAGKIHLVE
jgi:ATP-dependent helicase/nuclease subunit A